MTLCDGCLKQRSDVRACGCDYNGDPDAPCLCFLCRKEETRGRVYSLKTARYERVSYHDNELMSETLVL